MRPRKDLRTCHSRCCLGTRGKPDQDTRSLTINRKMAQPTTSPTVEAINSGASATRSRPKVSIDPTIPPTKLKVILSHLGIAVSALQRNDWQVRRDFKAGQSQE